MIVTGSDSASCGFPLRSRPAFEKISSNKHCGGASGQLCRMPSRKRGIAAADQRRRAVLHHGDQFRRRLPRVERHHDQAFGHDRQIHRDPVDAVCREQGAAVAFLQPRAARNARACPIASQQFAARDRHGLAVAKLLQDACSRRIQLRENVFEKVHGLRRAGASPPASKAHADFEVASILGELARLPTRLRAFVF